MAACLLCLPPFPPLLGPLRRLLDASALDFPEDTAGGPTLEDLSATQIQKVARGRMGRSYTHQLRLTMFQLALVLQKAVRGFVARQRYRRSIETNKKVRGGAAAKLPLNAARPALADLS